MHKPVLAILTDTIRYDNQAALKYFTKIKPVHFYKSAPYGDLRKEDLKEAISYRDFRDLEEKLIRLKPDIIQGAEPYGSRVQLKLCRIAYRISKKLNIPLIFPSLENRPVNSRFGKVSGPVLKHVLKVYAKQASLIFYLNEGAKKNLLKAGVSPEKLKSLLYGIWGINTDLFKPNIPLQERGLGQYILFVGRLDEAKGVPYILQAWKKIKDEFPKIELVFIGDDKLNVQVKGERIKKLGILKNEQLPPYFANALFTLCPSVTLKRWEEQVGMTNLQSLACGTPVITTKSGAIPEYINEKVGILIPEKNANALAEAMKKLLKNSKLRQKLGQNGVTYIKENFEVKKTIQKTEEILLGLIKKV
ncbi:MAG: glycosyltransferase [Patescibacteria group bacterium]|jgi:glycosyltransferase involved in cell wall biosynthesis